MLPLYDIRLHDGDGLRQVANAVRDLIVRLQSTPDHEVSDLTTVLALFANVGHQCENGRLWVGRLQEAELASWERDLARREEALAVREIANSERRWSAAPNQGATP